MPDSASISQLISQLGSLQPVPGVGGGDSGFRALDEGEVAAATLVTYGDAAIPELIEATKSDNWVVRYRSVDVLGMIGSKDVIAALVLSLADGNLRVQQSAMIALVGGGTEAFATIRQFAGASDFVAYLQRSCQFGLLRLMASHGSEQARGQIKRLIGDVNGLVGTVRSTIVDGSLSLKQRISRLRELKELWVAANPKKVFDVQRFSPIGLCDEIEKFGTQEEKQLVREFRPLWISATQGLLASDSGDTSQLLIAVDGDPARVGENARLKSELVRGADKLDQALSSPPAATEPLLRKAWNSLSGLWSVGRSIGASSSRQPSDSSETSTAATTLPAPVAPSSAVVGTETPEPLATQNVVSSSVPALIADVEIVRPAPSFADYARRTYNRIGLMTVAGMEMIQIPAGEFLMGDGDQNDNPRRSVYLDSYLIAQYPVTVKQYMAFVKASGYREPPKPSWGWKDDHPVVNVSWEDAQAYCAWASKEFGCKVMLPTEAQWEKASRGTDGRRYPWGNEWDSSRLHCSKKSYGDAGGTAAVGSFPTGASPYGVLDMAGNVWEWCSDWYDDKYMKTAPSRNPTGPIKGIARVLRGGSWGYNNGDLFRCACRDWGTPDYWYYVRGFRCAVPADSC